MSSGEIICRFCLKHLNIHKKNFQVDENISQLFLNVTGVPLAENQGCPTVTCELCVRSLQHCSAIKEQLIENQYSLLRTINTMHPNEAPVEDTGSSGVQEPEIEYKNFSDSGDEQEPLTKKIKLEPKSREEILWATPDPSASDLLEELLPIAPDQECLHCQEKLPNTFALKQHIKSEHAEEDISEQMIRCPFKNCQSSFKKFSSLNEHKKMHQLEGSISCETCGKICISKDQLRAHQKYHQEPKYKCHACDQYFYESQQLKNHNLNKHENVRNFKCPMCDKMYFKNSHLSRHVKVTHQKQTIVCNVPDCNRVYTRRERVITHICKQHPELSSEQIDFYVEAIKLVPYKYGIDDGSSVSLSLDDNDMRDEETNYSDDTK